MERKVRMSEWINQLSTKANIFLQLRVDKEDEIECIIRGGNFLLKNIADEVFEYHKEQSPPYVFQELDHSEIFPYLIVNIGSGVSMIKVTETCCQLATRFTRINSVIFPDKFNYREWDKDNIFRDYKSSKI